MHNPSKLFLQIFIGIVLLFSFCEYGIYFIVQSKCDWPELDPQKIDPNVESNSETPVKVMLIADTHLLGSRRGHWFDKLRREWQMHRAFQTAMYLHKPDLVFVLGDLTDEGLYCSRAEFEYYVNRFYSLFAVPNGTEMYVTVGNHDIGFHYGISPYLNNRFATAFNSPAVQFLTVKGNHFVLINSMALEGDGCFLCRPAEVQLNKIEKLLNCARGIGRCDTRSAVQKYSRPIMMQHFPLYRKSDEECGDYDAAPEGIKEERFREKWECISKESTEQLLKQIQPRLAFSGHTHHGCTKPLANGNGFEITIPSFSWRNKVNPNYGMLLVTPNNYSFSKCDIPTETTVIRLYLLGLSAFFFYLLYSFCKMHRKRKYKFN